MHCRIFGERIESRLGFVTNKNNHIFHNEHDYNVSGQTMRNKKLKQTNKIPIEQKLVKTQEAVDKVKTEAKHIQDSELVNDE